MYVEPGTFIKVLSGVKLTPTYEHTIWFPDKQTQANWFAAHTRYTFSEYTYQRVQRGYVRAGLNAEQLYDCNYMMFQNSTFGTKWFYAFIDNVEYINNETTEIHFHIDVIQTWLLDANIGMCMVERNHDTVDWVGSNLVPEPFVEVPVQSCYEDNIFKSSPLGSQTPWGYVILAQTDENGMSVPGEIINGVYSGLRVATFSESGASAGSYGPGVTMTEYLQSYEGRADSIISITKVPMDAAQISSIISQSSVPYNRATVTARAFNGYVPRNMKMYTAPYCYPALETIGGMESKLRFEWFDNHENIVFTRQTSAVPAPELYVYPQNYAGEQDNYEAGILLGEFAQGSWSGDTYQMWLAENTFPSFVRLAGTAAQIAYSFAADNPVTKATANDETGRHIAVRAGIEEATNIVANATHAASQTNPVYGNVQKAGLLTGLGVQSIYFKVKCVPYHIALMIDTYFSKYGYAQNKVMIPNLNARPHWTYIKTMDATISGNVPADDLRGLETIFNAGITFWNNGEEVGNYNLDNRGRPEG